LKPKELELKEEINLYFKEDLNLIHTIFGNNSYVFQLFLSILIPLFFYRVESLFQNGSLEELYKYFRGSDFSNYSPLQFLLEKKFGQNFFCSPNISKVTLRISEKNDDKEIIKGLLRDLDLLMIVSCIFPQCDISHLIDGKSFFKDDLSEITLGSDYILEFTSKYTSLSIIQSLIVIARNLFLKFKIEGELDSANNSIFKLLNLSRDILILMLRKIRQNIDKLLINQKKADFVFIEGDNPLADSSKVSHQLMDELKKLEISIKNISFTARKFIFISFFLEFYSSYLKHIRRFTFTNLNSLILLKELSYYQEEFEKISKIYGFNDKKYWEFVNSLVSLFASKPETIKMTINEGILANFDSNLYQQFISLREDFRTSDLFLYYSK
jgi:hypothetical protein